MRDFQFLVTDDRFEGPSAMSVQTRDEASARCMAERLLEHPDHRSVEVCDGLTSLFTLVADESVVRPRGRKVSRAFRTT